MLAELDAILQNLKQQNSSYYTEIACLHAKIEECLVLCEMVEKLKANYLKEEGFGDE